MAQVSAARVGAGVDPQVGTEAWGGSGRLFSPAHEDQMGRLQPPDADHSSEYRTREEAQGFARVRGSARDASLDRTHPQRAVPRTNERALPVMARRQGGAERAGLGSGDVEAVVPCANEQ